MLSSEVFRYTKPVAPQLEVYVQYSGDPVFTDQEFTDSINIGSINSGSVDVLKNGIALANPDNILTGKRDYNVDHNGLLTMVTPGTYTLRTYSNALLFDANVFKPPKFSASEGQTFATGVPCYPEILLNPIKGYARIANNRLGISYLPFHGVTGLDSIGYRLVNAYGQVSEPNCIYITIV